MLDLESLFEAQKVLDERIIAEKGLRGQDLFPGKVLALAVEVGELANAWRGFKHWSEDKTPRPNMLEEYVDCLHFLLSLGLDVGCYPQVSPVQTEKVDRSKEDIIKSFNKVFALIGEFRYGSSHIYLSLFTEVYRLGVKLGFSWDEIQAAYLRKNKINHERQENGY